MLSAPRAPQARSACPFARRHDRSSHLHVSVAEPRAPYSHDHMIVPMCHACLAFSLLHLPTAQESSAAFHTECHFCVRHFGRVFDLPYKLIQRSGSVCNGFGRRMVQAVLVAHGAADEKGRPSSPGQTHHRQARRTPIRLLLLPLWLLPSWLLPLLPQRPLPARSCCSCATVGRVAGLCCLLRACLWLA